MAELGQTTNPRELIPGSPESIAADLRSLVANIDKVGRAGSELQSVDPGDWTGDAASTFRQEFGLEPPRWFETIAGFDRRGHALAEYAEYLNWGHGEAQRAIEMYLQAQAATRGATAQHNNAVQAAASGGGAPPGSFQDPGAGLAQEAQLVLNNARVKVSEAGDRAARGETSEDEGRLRDRRFGNQNRDDDAKGRIDHGRAGRSYRYGNGDVSDGMLHDKTKAVLEDLGVDVNEETYEAEAGVAFLEGELGGDYKSGIFSGEGSMSGGILGANADATFTSSNLGVSAGASAEAYLAKGGLSGEQRIGDHVAVSGNAEGFAGGKADAGFSAGATGVNANASAFAGGEVSADIGAEVGGVKGGVEVGARAGIGAEADAQFGMGEDGKFHIGASFGASLGIGGTLGFEFAVDPSGVVDFAKDAGGFVADTAETVANAASDAVDTAGDVAGNVAEGICNTVSGALDAVGL